MDSLAKLESQLEPFFTKKLPSLPDGIKEFIVKISPYFAIIGVIVSLPAVLTLLGLGALVAPFTLLNGFGSYAGFSLSIIFVAVNLVLLAMAIPGLFARTAKAWRLLFYSALVSAISSLLSFSIGNLVVGTAINLYFLFQVRSYYK